MQIFFKSRDPQAGELQEVVQRRMRFVFRRIHWLVPKATVQLSDVNGPRGGIDKRCQIELRSDLAGNVVVSSVARDWRSALDQAMARAARFLMRQWGRRMDNRRMRRHPLLLSPGEQPLG